jgi:hypothetical protein
MYAVSSVVIAIISARRSRSVCRFYVLCQLSQSDRGLVYEKAVGLYQGRNFGSNFGVGATSGPDTFPVPQTWGVYL